MSNASGGASQLSIKEGKIGLETHIWEKSVVVIADAHASMEEMLRIVKEV